MIYSNFPVENTKSGLEHLMNNEAVKRVIETAKIIADLGSGIGTSTLAIAHLCPSANEIHSVDANFHVLNEEFAAEMGEKSIHHPLLFHDFLQQVIESGNKFDLILIKSAPEHQLHKNDGYKLLAEVMNEGGMVLEIGDTGLDAQKMLEFFNLEENSGGYDLYRHIAWIKK